MPKARDKSEPQKVEPVRLVLDINPADRQWFRTFCSAKGEDMAKLGTRWLLERLAIEDRAGHFKPKP